MPHNPNHSWGDLGTDALDFFTNSDNLSGLVSLGVGNAAINRLENLGDDAVSRGNELLTDLTATGKFNPFTVTAGPGQVKFDKFGGANYSTDGSMRDFQTNLTDTAGAAYNAIFNPVVDPVTGEVTIDQRGTRQNLINMITGATDATGSPLNLNADGRAISERDQLVSEMVGANTSLTDPFTAAGRKTREQDIFDRLQALREPQNEEARVNLDQQLFNQGRGGLRTAQYGGSPEELALQKAIQSQRSADAVTAIEQGRAEAMDLTDARLKGLQESRLSGQSLADQVFNALGIQTDQVNVGTAATSRMLKDAFLPQLVLADLAGPSIQASDLANTQARQLAGYGRDIGLGTLDYDLQTEKTAGNLRLAQAEALINLLIGRQNNAQPASTSGSGNLFERLIELQKSASQGNANYDPNDPSTWYGGDAPNLYDP